MTPACALVLYFGGAEADAVIRPEAVAAIGAAKQAGKAVAILSNELNLFYGADFRGSLAFMALIDLVIDATYTGILKPDPPAYAAVTQGLGLPPGDCVFVDDQERNVEGARRAGLRALAFDVCDPAGSYARALAEHGLAPDRAEAGHA